MPWSERYVKASRTCPASFDSGRGLANSPDLMWFSRLSSYHSDTTIIRSVNVNDAHAYTLVLITQSHLTYSPFLEHLESRYVDRLGWESERSFWKRPVMLMELGVSGRPRESHSSAPCWLAQNVVTPNRADPSGAAMSCLVGEWAWLDHEWMNLIPNRTWVWEWNFWNETWSSAALLQLKSYACAFTTCRRDKQLKSSAR